MQSRAIDADLALEERAKELLRDETARDLLTKAGSRSGSTRERAIGGLSDLGFTEEEVASALAFEEALKPPSKKFQQIAGTVAGIGIPAAINLIPGLAAAPEEIVTGPLVAKTLAKLGLRAGGVGAAGAAGAIADVAADPDRDLTIENAFEAARAGLIEEGAIEGVFGAGEMGIARMFGRSGRMAAADIDRLNGLLNASAKRQGITQPIKLLPGQASQLPSSQAIEAIAESSLFGANPVAKTKALIRKSAVNMVNELPETIADGTSSLSARNVTNATKDVLLGNESFHSKAAQSLYDRAFELVDEAGQELVEVTKTVKTPAGKILSEAGEPIIAAGTKKVTEEVPKSGLFADLSKVKATGDRLRAQFAEAQDFGFEGKAKSLIERAQNAESTTSVRGIQKMRSDLLSLQRDLERTASPNSNLMSVVGELVPVLDDTMKSAADAASGDARRMILRANKMWKANKEVFDNKVIKSIVSKASDTNPQAVFDILNSADEQQVSTLIQGLTKRVGGKDVLDTAALDKIKGGYLAGMISKLSPEDAFKKAGKGEAVGDLLLRQFNSVPDQVKNQLFTGAEQTDIIDKFRILSLSQKSGESGLVGLKAGQLFGILGISAAALGQGGEFKKEIVGTGGLLAIGPSILADIMLKRPRFTRLLAEGAKLSPTSREGIKVTGRLAKMVLDERKRILKQRKAVDEAIKEPSPNNKPRQDQVRAFGGTSF
jgi:hypothetical protein